MPGHTSRTFEQVIEKYVTVTSDGNDDYAWDALTGSAAIVAVKELRVVRSILQDNRRDILTLGTEGLHLILKEHARKIRAAKTARLKRLRLKRRKAKEAQR